MDRYYISLDIDSKNKDSNTISRDMTIKKWAGDILSLDIVILSKEIITIS